MKKMMCEICGKIDIVKTEENLFQCRQCGCKYTPEQARALISETAAAIQPGLTIRAGTVVRYTGAATEVVIPEGVVAIGANAFKDCLGLTSVKIPEGVEEICQSAFENCTRLTKVILPKSCHKIGVKAFYRCWGLADVMILSEKIALDYIRNERTEDGYFYPFDGGMLHYLPVVEQWKKHGLCERCGGVINYKGLFATRRECSRCVCHLITKY